MMINDVVQVSHFAERVMKRMDVVSNNLANAATTGFKQDCIVYESGKESKMFDEKTVIDFRQGSVQFTGNLFDFALSGEGFFVVQTAEGLRYTRRGDFTIDHEGYLVTQWGDRVMGISGPLRIQGSNVDVSSDGTLVVDGNPVGQLSIVTFKNLNKLSRDVNGYFRSEESPEQVEKHHNVRQRYLEFSNVNVIREMVNMIELHRLMETYQRLIQTINDGDKLSTSRIGRIA
ncbi:MAG: flagellar hook basal-body protein [Syntrophales bacterium]|nr:flagellar hook basal-body protein [Syntrophales bacterium]